MQGEPCEGEGRGRMRPLPSKEQQRSPTGHQKLGGWVTEQIFFHSPQKESALLAPVLVSRTVKKYMSVD